MDTRKKPTVAPATGKLGILTPGLGAVSSTFMVGTKAVIRGLGEPIGSLTQMGAFALENAKTTPTLLSKSLFL